VVPLVASMLRVQRHLDSRGGAALTFDDGPHEHGTPAILKELDAAGAVATFFLAGEQVERRPGLAAEIVAAGHEVALHCHRHRNLLRLGPGQIADDIQRGAEAIHAATGQILRLYRPPYGVFSAVGLAVSRRLGWHPFLWSRWGRDWRAAATPESIATDVTADVQAGDVLLLHDSDYYSAPGSWRATAAALPIVMDELAKRNLPPVGVT
jgi:peptidoglycan-N-acetylglucosamine deacetylase